MVIDVHVHVFPDEVAARAIPKMSARAGVTPFSDGTVNGLLGTMRRSGVDLSVIQPVATRPEQVESINRWSLGLRDTPGLICYGALHPDLAPEAMAEQIAFLVRQGFPGVKLHPDYQCFHPDEDRLAEMYEALAKAGLTVLFHAGIDLGLYPPLMCTPEQIAQVHRTYPSLRIIAAHMGGFKMWDEVERHLIGTGVRLDTAYCARDLPPERFRELVHAHGPEKVLFASDAPWGDQAAELALVRGAGLTPDETAAVLGGNAVRCLGLGKPSR